jgi:hypothetical protein
MISKKGTGWPVANAYSAVVVVGRNESITRGDEVVRPIWLRDVA